MQMFMAIDIDIKYRKYMGICSHRTNVSTQRHNNNKKIRFNATTSFASSFQRKK